MRQARCQLLDASTYLTSMGGGVWIGPAHAAHETLKPGTFHCMELHSLPAPAGQVLPLPQEPGIGVGAGRRGLSGVHPFTSGPGFQKRPAHTPDLSCKVQRTQGHPSCELESTYCYTKGFWGLQGHAPNTTIAHPSLFPLLSFIHFTENPQIWYWCLVTCSLSVSRIRV